MSALRTLFFGLTALIGLTAHPVLAAVSDWVTSEEASVRLISATDAVGDLGELRFGLEIRLQPGWKTYWRSPGDGGLPPVLEWGESANIAGTRMEWPAPHRFTILGIDSIGYIDHVIYPIRVAPERPGEAVTAHVSLDYLTCNAICVPQQANLTLRLPAGVAVPSESAFLLGQASGRVPGPSMPGFQLAKAEVMEGQGARWYLKLETATPLNKPDVFIESPDPNFGFGAPERLGPTRMRVPILYAMGDPSSLVSQPLTVTLTDGKRAFEDRIVVTAAPMSSANLLAWLTILVTAFAGGLILNLMPCVLPVLSIKLLGVVRYGGGDIAKARGSFLATAAGILVSFGALAAAAIAMKSAGMAVGWGIQFQEPAFITFMALVCVLFAANLWGLFEMPMPAVFGRMGGGNAGSFATGLFATLLATPCSAPFVGTAIAFALGQGWVETVSIFAAMGLGLAFPYLIVAVRPQLATALPRPGRWMIWVRAVLGVALAGTAIWLGSILLSLAGQAAVIGLAIVCAGLLIWLALPVARLRLPVAAALVVAGVALSTQFTPEYGNTESSAKQNAIWMPFSQDYLADLVASGRTVMVDVTADWCITCKANKAAVLERGEVARLLGGDVAALRADWTRPDPAVQAYLASFNRYGIPFNAVYGPGAPSGIALPEILSEEVVLRAFQQAAATQ